MSEGDAQQRDYWTPNEVAEALSLGISTTRKLIADGEIESFRIGTLVRVRKQAVSDFVERLIREQA